MAVQDDLAAARRAVQLLEETAVVLRRHYGESVDSRRFESDVSRLAVDLDLLCGPVATAAPQQLEVIDDTEYAHDFWMDAEDEGLGASDRRAP